MYSLSVFLVGSIGDGAGIDDDDVGLFTLFGTLVSFRDERGHEGATLREVQLTSECDDTYLHIKGVQKYTFFWTYQNIFVLLQQNAFECT